MRPPADRRIARRAYVVAKDARLNAEYQSSFAGSDPATLAAAQAAEDAAWDAYLSAVCGEVEVQPCGE
jgi:hypothetical protein